jgi:hypothetical protein
MHILTYLDVMSCYNQVDSSYATHFIDIVRNTPSLAVMVLEGHFARLT